MVRTKSIVWFISAATSLVASNRNAVAATTYASVIAINSDGGVFVEQLNNNGLPGCSPILGPSTAAIGSLTTIAADMDNDGLTDIVSWSPNSVSVSYGRVSVSGSFFSAPVQLSSGAFSGTVNTIGDMDGDQVMDLVAWSRDAVFVEYGTAGRGAFSLPVAFATAPVFGNVRTMVMDVDVDGKMDLVAWNSDSIYYQLSRGFFAGPVALGTRNQPFYGSFANLWAGAPIPSRPRGAPFGLLAWNFDSIFYETVIQTPPVQLSRGAFAGSVANLMMDVNFDGLNDLVAVNSSDAWVELDVGSHFDTPARFCNNGPFFGNIATAAGYTAR